MTGGAWHLTTHAIDPEVDEARDYLIQDIAAAQGLARFGFTEGVGEATPNAPRKILLGDPYWTDGFRVVMQIASEPTGLDEVGFFYWDWYEDWGGRPYGDALINDLPNGRDDKKKPD